VICEEGLLWLGLWSCSVVVWALYIEYVMAKATMYSRLVCPCKGGYTSRGSERPVSDKRELVFTLSMSQHSAPAHTE